MFGRFKHNVPKAKATRQDSQEYKKCSHWGILRHLIKAYGHIEEGGKHPKAIIDNYTMPYKREKRAKSCYVKELLDIIDSL